jgi:hypothetical protein
MVVYLTMAMDYGSYTSRIKDAAGSSQLIRGNESQGTHKARSE